MEYRNNIKIMSHTKEGGIDSRLSSPANLLPLNIETESLYLSSKIKKPTKKSKIINKTNPVETSIFTETPLKHLKNQFSKRSKAKKIQTKLTSSEFPFSSIPYPSQNSLIFPKRNL